MKKKSPRFAERFSFFSALFNVIFSAGPVARINTGGNAVKIQDAS